MVVKYDISLDFSLKSFQTLKTQQQQKKTCQLEHMSNHVALVLQGVPEPAVKNKMRAEGLDPSLLE